jgi:hypothetical protein
MTNPIQLLKQQIGVNNNSIAVMIAAKSRLHVQLKENDESIDILKAVNVELHAAIAILEDSAK